LLAVLLLAPGIATAESQGLTGLSPACLSQNAFTNSAAFLLAEYLARPGNVRWVCPSGWWLGPCSHCLSTCPRARSST